MKLDKKWNEMNFVKIVSFHVNITLLFQGKLNGLLNNQLTLLLRSNFDVLLFLHKTTVL